MTDTSGAPEVRGFFDGEWFVEEKVDAHRFGVRVSRRLHEEVTPFQRLAIYDTPFFGKLLTLDDLVMLTERDEFVYHEMLIHVPLISHPDPRSVLIVGGGDCGCVREVLKHPGIERVVQCEIDERVTRVCADHFDWVAAVERDSRVELIFADGAEYLDEQESSFDLVVIDSTDPIGAAVTLFQRDFYSRVARALRPGGIMTAQTESPHWGAPLVSEIYRELRSAFTHVDGYLGMIPTYPSGMWSWAYASNDRQHGDHVNEARAVEISKSCQYYNRRVQDGAFLLPEFARRAIEGEATYGRFDRRPGNPVGE